MIELGKEPVARWSTGRLAGAIAMGVVGVVAVSYLAYATWPSKPTQSTYRNAATIASQPVESDRGGGDRLGREVAELRAEIEALKASLNELRRQGGLAVPPAYREAAEPATPVAGKLDRVLNTATLVVGGRKVAIHGLRGIDDPQHVASLAKFIEQSGGSLTCEARGEQFLCKTANGHDVAAVVLSNGGGRAAEDAPADYRRLEQEAKRKKLGVWRS